MDENTFSNLILRERAPVPRQEPRFVLSIPLFLETKGQIFRVNLVDISPTVLRIDQRISMTFQDRVSVTFQVQIPFQIMSIPVITDREFKETGWNRLSIVSTFDFQKLVKVLTAQAQAQGA